MINKSMAIISIKTKPIIFRKLYLFVILVLLVLPSTNSFKSTFKVPAKLLACSKLGAVSPNSHLEIVCLATFIFSANSYYFSFLILVIFY